MVPDSELATSSRSFWPMIALLSLATGVTDTIFSGIRSLWGDEAFTAVVSSLSTHDFWHVVLHDRDAVNATYDLVMRSYIAIAGHDTLILRLPSAAFMAVTCAGIMSIAWKLVSTRVAILTGVFFLMLPLVQGFGSEARSYALSAAVATWATWFLVRLNLDSRRYHLWLWCYFAAIVLLGYVFLYAYAIVAAQALFMASHRSTRGRVRTVLLVQGTALIAMVPLLVISWREHGEISWIPSGLRAMIYNSAGVFITPFWSGMASTPYPELLALAAWTIIALGIYRLANAGSEVKESWFAVRLGLAWVIVPGVIFSVASLLGHYFTLRYLVFCAPAVALLLGISVDRLRSTSWRIGFIVIFATLVLLSDSPLFSPAGKDGWGSTLQVLQSQGGSGDYVMPTPQTYGGWLILDPRVTGLPHGMTLIDFGHGRDWTPMINVPSWVSPNPPPARVIWLVARFGVISCTDLVTLRRWGFKASAVYGGTVSPTYKFVSLTSSAKAALHVPCSGP